MQAQSVPWTNPVCPWDNPGTKGAEKVYVLKVYVPFSLLAEEHAQKHAKEGENTQKCANRGQRKTQGQQLKGKIVSALSHTSHTFPHFFTLFPPGLSLKIKPFLKRRKENKKKNTETILHVSCCTFVILYRGAIFRIRLQ